MNKKIIRIKKTNIFLLAIFVVGLIGIVGCNKRAEKNPKTEKKKIVITYAFGAGPEHIEMTSRVISSFEERHPGIRVKKEHIVGDIATKIKTAMAGNAAPDVIVFDDEPFPAFASRGTLLNLDPYIKKENYSLDDFYPQCLKPFTYQNKVYGLPAELGVMVLYYNKDLFDQVGLNYPDETWTWDTLLQRAKKLTRDIDGDGRIDQFGFQMSAWWVYWLPILWSYGGDMLNEDMTQCVIDTPEAKEALQYIWDLYNKYRVCPSLSTMASMGYSKDTPAHEMFSNGRLATFIEGPWFVLQFKNIKTFKWDIALVPKGKEGRFSRCTTNGLAIWSGTKHPQEAWELLKFLCGPEIAHKRALRGESTPARRSVAQSDSYLKESAYCNKRVFLESLEQSRPSPIPVKYAELNAMIDVPVEELAMGKISVEEAVKRIKTDADNVLSAQRK